VEKLAATAGSLVAVPGQVAADLANAARNNIRGRRTAAGAPVPNVLNPAEAIRFTANSLLDRGLYAALATVENPETSRAELSRYHRELGRASTVAAAQGWLESPASFHRAATLPRLTAQRVTPIGDRAERVEITFHSAYRSPAELPGSARYASYRPLRTVKAN